MNRMILVGLFLHCFVWTAFGQKVDIETMIKESNFKVIEDDIVWQKIYNDKLEISSYEKFIRAKNSLENIQIIDSTLIGTLKWFMCEFQKSDPLPLYFLDYFSGTVKIDFRKDKYRISVYNIKTKSATGAAFAKDISGPGVESKLISFYYKPFKKEKTPREGFYINDTKILERNFLRLLEYKAIKSDF